MTRWRTAYFIAINTALLWVVTLVATHAGIVSYHWLKARYGPVSMPPEARATYSGRTPAEIDQLWRDSLALRFRYQPVVGLVQEQLTSRFFNVDKFGVRSNGGPSNPIDGSTWIFGGSTTFGIAVADAETIPAFLERRLGRAVINFAVRSHGSLHENRLLRHYLRLGYRPRQVIFLDGVNETCDVDLDTDALGDLVARSQQGYQWDPAYPVVYAARTLGSRIGTAVYPPIDPPASEEVSCRLAGAAFPLSAMTRRLLAERDALCALYEVTCQTFVQPFGGLHGHDTEPGFRETTHAEHMRALFEHLEPVWKDASAIFVTNALDALPEHPYIDAEHYSVAGHRAIADAIAIHLATSAVAGRASSAAEP